MLSEIANHIVRTAHLLALTVIPKGLSPEPPPPENLVWSTTLAVLAITAALYGAVRLRDAVDSTAARVSAALVWLAVAVALGTANFYKGPRGPLEGGIVVTAIPVWAALAATASVAAGHFLGSDFKNRRMGAVVIVLGLGAIQYARAATFLGSADKMWKEALRHDAANEEALAGVMGPLLRSYRYDDARKIADRCMAIQPEACACLEARARVALRKVADRCLAPPPDACACQNAGVAAQGRSQALDAALADAREAAAKCPERAASRAILAETLAIRGESEEAEKEATAAVALPGYEDRSRYALALTLQGQGRYDEAMEELKRAIGAGAGRDAKLLAGAVALIKGDAEEAQRLLAPLGAAGSNDAVATYNLALIADKKGDYNGARQGYLATLRIDPCYSSARYNLVHLTWKAGIQDEARHHARKYAEMAAPGDPSVDQLSALVGVNIRLPEGAPQGDAPAQAP